MPYPELGLFIDGAWCAASDGRTRDVIDPCTGNSIAVLPVASPADIDRALAAAARGFETWRVLSPAARAALMLDAASRLRERRAELAETMAMELGKPYQESLLEADRVAEHVEWHANEGRRVYGRVIPSAANLRQQTLLQPIGPVAAFSPWNGPGASPARKISAALGAGCSIVLKPAEETPGTACLIVRCFAEAGLPAGVLNLLVGDPADLSARLIASPAIRAVSFTGSVPVGRHLAELAARHLKPIVLELGGHAPVIVCADADVPAAARLSARTKFRNSGQICISPTRFLVHEEVHDAFVAAFVAQTEALTVGPPMQAGTQMGPLANGRRLAAVERLVADARQRGATLACGGRRIGTEGFFYAPTVLTEVPPDAAVLSEEPFGPIATVTRFSRLEDAVAQANALPLGLAAYAFTDSARVAHLLAERLECGLLSINHFGGASPDIPFGGVKDSGYGREGGAECFDGYLIRKSVSHLMA